jgi:hypothetical protein
VTLHQVSHSVSPSCRAHHSPLGQVVASKVVGLTSPGPTSTSRWQPCDLPLTVPSHKVRAVRRPDFHSSTSTARDRFLARLAGQRQRLAAPKGLRDD